jgi:hypothetical protein
MDAACRSSEGCHCAPAWPVIIGAVSSGPITAWADSGVAGPDPYEAAIRDDWADLVRRFAGAP